MDDNQEDSDRDSGTEYQDAVPDVVDSSGLCAESPPQPPAAVQSKTFDHPLYKGDKFELRAGPQELGLVLTVPRGKTVSVRFSADRWETTQEVDGELLGTGAGGQTDRVFFRVPVGRDAIRVVGGEGGVDFAVRYHEQGGESTV